jgi:hypothetical protein
MGLGAAADHRPLPSFGQSESADGPLAFFMSEQTLRAIARGQWP